MDYVDSNKLKYITGYSWRGICKAEIYSDIIKDTPIVSNAANVMISTAFANSEHCEFIQLVDIIAYLSHKNDLKEEKQNLSDFGERLVDIYNQIDKELIQQNIRTLKRYK